MMQEYVLMKPYCILYSTPCPILGQTFRSFEVGGGRKTVKWMKWILNKMKKVEWVNVTALPLCTSRVEVHIHVNVQQYKIMY